MSSPSSSCLLLMAKGSVMRPPRRAQMMMILANKSRPEGLLSVRSASGWVRRRLPSSTVVPQQEIRSNPFRYRGQGPCRFVHSGSKAITAETTAKSQQQQQQQRQSSTETEPSALLSTNTASAIVVPSSTDDATDISSSTAATATTNQLSSSSSSSKLRSYSELAKARLSALVVSTTAAGYLSATAAGSGAGAGGAMLLSPTLVSCLAGTALCSSSAAAWNQIFEVDRDARMKRTATRPLVTGALSQSQAVSAATAWGVTGTAVLAAGTDPVTTALGMSNILLYAGLYTYLKPRSVTNTWVGAVVGAIPPVMGFTAATGGGGDMMDAVVGAETAALLAATLYLWQMPHFFALSYMHRVDYKRGGFVMVPTVEPDGERHCAQLVVRYSWYLSAIPVVATAAEVTSSMFLLEGLVLNGYALAVAHRFERQRTNANARKVFLTSLWYLPSLLMLFLLHSKVWDEQDETVEDTTMAVVQKQQQQSFLPSLRTYIHRIREKGRELCWHEALLVSSSTSSGSSSDGCCTAKDEDSSKNKTLVGAAAAAACPVVVGKETSRQAQLQVATAASAAAAVAADVMAESPQPVAVKLTPPSEQTTAQDSSSR